MQNFEDYFIDKEKISLSISEQKKRIRSQLIAKREEIHRHADPQNWGPKQFYRALELLKIKHLDDLNHKYLVSCFFPIKHELDMTSFAKSNWLFPRIDENKSLSWFEYGDGKTNYIINKFGIKEKEKEFCFEYKVDFLPLLCFVPGLAADKDGNRLGYGGGYYDKFLSEFKDKVTSVLCLPSHYFVFNELPHDEFDEKVDLIVF